MIYMCVNRNKFLNTIDTNQIQSLPASFYHRHNFRWRKRMKMAKTSSSMTCAKMSMKRSNKAWIEISEISSMNRQCLLIKSALTNPPERGHKFESYESWLLALMMKLHFPTSCCRTHRVPTLQLLFPPPPPPPSPSPSSPSPVTKQTHQYFHDLSVAINISYIAGKPRTLSIISWWQWQRQTHTQRQRQRRRQRQRQSA